jgi:hypothetical protein
MEPHNIKGLNIPLLQLTYHKVISDYNNQRRKDLNARKYINLYIYCTNNMKGFANISDFIDNIIKTN